MEKPALIPEQALKGIKPDNSSVNLLHIIDGLGVGGAEMLVVTLLKNLKDYNLHLIVLGKPDTLAGELPPSCKLTILDFKTYRDIPSCARFINRYIKVNRIQVIHSHLYWSNVIARLATPRRIPLFNCIHNISSLASYNVNRLSLYLERFTYRRRHHIIAVSKTVLNDFDEFVGLKGPSTVLYNIIRDEFFTALPKQVFSKDEIRLVAIGNLRKQKNYSYILKAFQTVPKNVSLDIYGIGPLQEEIQKEIDAGKLNIRLCGLRSDMDEVLRGYDAFVMCSTHEGFSVALMEALSSGLPAFLSDIPVQHESAEDAAVYFNLQDPEDFGRKLMLAFADTERLKQMSKKGVERAALLTKKEHYIKKLESLYHTA